MKHCVRWCASFLLATTGLAASGPDVARCETPPDGSAVQTGAVELDLQAGRRSSRRAAGCSNPSASCSPARPQKRMPPCGWRAAAELLRLTGKVQTVEFVLRRRFRRRRIDRDGRDRRQARRLATGHAQAGPETRHLHPPAFAHRHRLH